MAFLSLLRLMVISLVYVQFTCAQHCENGVKMAHFELPKSIMHPKFGYCFNVSEVKPMVSKLCCAGYYEEGDNCLPVCKNGCQHGECTSPDNCKCNEGYVMANGRCVLSCDPGCVSGDCIAAGKCRCWKGYRTLTESNVCIPTCEPPCENGTCVGVNQCRCHNGYINSTDNYRCEPICDPQYTMVENGVCIAPNVLRCNTAFTLTLSADSTLACTNDSQIHKSSFNFNAVLRKFCIIASIITGLIVIVAAAVKILKCVFMKKFQINIYGHSPSEGYNDAEHGSSSNSPITTTIMSSSPLPQTRKSSKSKYTKM
ncbi:epidermal growth factor-like protein isoform X2 [Ochlerotatus camptorhynchus]|uniref:epidermal growth factor-like protein isoform X2 n=1 Tax=Ochlerotatus camptorhynchus TaxID=644619 RepID=UPI0031D54347